MNFDKLIDYIKIDKQEFYFQFNSHPSFPSVLALSDTLNFMGVRNEAYELDKEYWDELPKEFITIVDHSFSLIKKNENHFTQYSDQIKNISKENLYKGSDDFVLLFEKTENVKNILPFNFQPIIYLVFGIVLLYSLIQFSWYESTFNILSLLGVYISLELFNQKFGEESIVVNNICGRVANNGSQSPCLKIFSSDKIDILGLKLSDFSLIYYLGITVIGLIFPNAQFVLKVIASISCLVILYSLYIQVFVEKALCKICILIIFILLAQTTISLLCFKWEVFLSVIFISIILFIVIFSTLVFVNNLMIQREELKKSNAKNLRFKRNYDLFKRELLDHKKIEFNDNQTFFLGNRDSKLHISIISNPYCGFCKRAHEIIEDLLKKYPNDISVQIRFNYFPESSEKYTQLISDFLNIYKNKFKNEFLKAVEIYFESKNEDKVREISNMKTIEDLSDIIQISKENITLNLSFTPILIINGYKFPEKYDREDIYYFIDELIEDEDI